MNVISTVAEEMFPVQGLVDKLVTIENIGNFTATLSVPQQDERKVYWSRKEMSIRVTPNDILERLNELKRNYTNLYQQFVNVVNKTGKFDVLFIPRGG